MAKLLIVLFMLFTCLQASSIVTLPLKTDGSSDMVALKAFVTMPPVDLEPEVALMVGTMFQNGMKELGINKNINKAKIYFKSAGDRGVAMGYLILANIALSENNDKEYVEKMELVIKANDKALSSISGLQLAAYWVSKNQIERSFEPLIYVADVYDNAKAQFMIGWSIATKSHIPHNLSEQDGQFYLYQACNNPSRTEKIQLQCTMYADKKSHK